MSRIHWRKYCIAFLVFIILLFAGYRGYFGFFHKPLPVAKPARQTAGDNPAGYFRLGESKLDFDKSVKLTWMHSSIEPGIKKAKEEIANRYMKIHPNTEIEISVRHPYDYYDWIKATLAANNPADIITIDSTEEGTLFDPQNGWFIDLKPYLEMKNPYTGLTWQNEFSTTFTGHYKYGYYSYVPYQMRISKLIYNKQHFKEIGFSETPKNWGDFMEALKRLKSKGHIPFGIGINDNSSQLLTLNSLLLDQIYFSRLPQVDVLSKDGKVQKNEMLQAIASGILDVKNPDIIKVLDLYKEFAVYWNEGFADTGEAEVRDMFIDGKVSVIIGSTWDVPAYSKNKKLDWGVFSFPVLNKGTIPSSTEKVIEPGAIQDEHAVTSAAKKRGTADYAVDFLMTFSSYEAIVLLDEAFGVYVPTSVDVNSGKWWGDNYSQFQENGEILPYITPILYTFGDSNIADNINKQTLLFLTGQITSREYLDILAEKTIEKTEEIKRAGEN